MKVHVDRLFWISVRRTFTRQRRSSTLYGRVESHDNVVWSDAGSSSPERWFAVGTKGEEDGMASLPRLWFRLDLSRKQKKNREEKKGRVSTQGRKMTACMGHVLTSYSVQ